MARRWGLGPVFWYEVITSARRVRVYAARVGFVLVLLGGLALLWAEFDRDSLSPSQMALVGRTFYSVVLWVQMAAVLLAAPAATAGSICVDKGRGCLEHIFVTDLRDREIVLGKLGARLLPVLALMSGSIPVMALCSFLGGVDLPMAVSAYLVTVGVAGVGCALALLFSVWARKPHHALLPTYALLGLWVFLYPWVSFMFGWPGWRATSDIETFLLLSNPFGAVVGPLYTPGAFAFVAQLGFLGATVLVSFTLALIATRRMRRTALRLSARPARRERPSWVGKLVALVPGPTLDADPVLWREWHRKKPTRWTGRMWTVYAVVVGLGSLYVIAQYFLWPGGSWNLYMAAQVNAWGGSFGLLLLSISAAMALAEERDRGSLDVIMATPLSTWEILRGKWWGTFAIVPRLAIFPIWVSAALAMVSGQWVGLLMMIGLILAYSAAITSLGLAVATWVPKLSRAVGWCVVAYVAVSLSVLMLPSLQRPWYWGRPADPLPYASPHFGIAWTTENAGELPGRWASHDTLAALPWIVFYLVVSAIFMGFTLLTFDRCLGRARSRRIVMSSDRSAAGFNDRLRQPGRAAASP